MIDGGGMESIFINDIMEFSPLLSLLFLSSFRRLNRLFLNGEINKMIRGGEGVERYGNFF